jgi:hypothetical protein
MGIAPCRLDGPLRCVADGERDGAAGVVEANAVAAQRRARRARHGHRIEPVRAQDPALNGERVRAEPYDEGGAVDGGLCLCRHGRRSGGREQHEREQRRARQGRGTGGRRNTGSV